MDEKFKFKLSPAPSASYSDAEALFRDLKNRDPKIQHLWSHQADIIRAYHKNIDKVDIALELPTGAGKTLVGLLIAEWRRLTLNQRIAYLCPTRQLAFQVGQKAAEYGIRAHVLVGPQTQYPAGHFSDYASSNAIAVTTYSGIFNINPRIDNPETIVLDDAHAGENYIAKMWSLNISRFDHGDLYERVIDLYSQAIPDYFLSILKDDNANPSQKQAIDLVPGPKFSQKFQALIDLFDETTERTELSYPWMLIRNKLNACYCFFSWSEILIRPWMPPTLTHTPFSNAKQRLYMSATIGAGGELERITGIKKIHRIPVPSGWDKQSTGRRLFIFPDRSFSANEYEPWLADTLSSSERALVLTPQTLALEAFSETIAKYQTKFRIIGAQDVEESLDAFVNESKTILALTNRYDGLDLPGDTCRMLIVYGLPASVNLLERFLWSKLGLSTVLRDRIKTRITQAVGRCTRNSTDYAAVIMIGESLFEFCIKRENRTDIHPELRAEMEFGLDNSDAKDIHDLTTLINLFLNRDPSWSSAETDIAKRRDESVSPLPEYVKTLREVVDLEVEFQYDLWKEDYGGALTKATKITDALSGDALASYRALWNYFAGCSSYQLGQLTKNKELVQTASDRFYRASQAVRTVSWFARLAHEFGSKIEESKVDYLTILVAESINSYLIALGTVGARFEKAMSEYNGLIKGREPDKFDRGITELGRMIGFDAERPEGAGAPDCIWRIANNYVVIFECKSDEQPENGISIKTCRQAQGHKDWHKSHPFFTQNAKMFVIVVSPRKFLDKSALPHSKELYYLHIDDVRKLFSEVESCLRLIRSKSPDLENEQRLQLIQAEIISSKLTPNDVIKRLITNRLSDIAK